MGSVALDTVETPFGQVKEALGGSAVYFSAAASVYHPVSLVGVVGDDFPVVHLELLRRRGIDLGGLEVARGRTFRWAGRYDHDLNVARTLDTQLNVFADFRPQLPAEYQSAEFAFLANIDPELQLDVLRQMQAPKLSVLDSMNYWIENKRQALTKVISRVDAVLLNEGEAREYAGTYSLLGAARAILALGPKAVVVKKGEYGAALFTAEECFFVPAYPCEMVKDPTGAGDSFAGGFVGYLAKAGEVTPGNIKRALVHGTVMASFTVEDFSINRLCSVTWPEVEERYQAIKRFTHFDGPF